MAWRKLGKGRNAIARHKVLEERGKDAQANAQANKLGKNRSVDLKKVLEEIKSDFAIAITKAKRRNKKGNGSTSSKR